MPWDVAVMARVGLISTGRYRGHARLWIAAGLGCGTAYSDTVVSRTVGRPAVTLVRYQCYQCLPESYQPPVTSSRSALAGQLIFLGEIFVVKGRDCVLG